MRYFEVENLLRKGKLSPRFVGLFEILERVGTLAYKVALPSSLSKIHNVFYISTLRKYVFDASHVVELEPIQISEDLSYEKVHVQIVDVVNKVLLGLAKFDTTREHDTNPTRFWWVWVEYNRVWVISVLTRLTRLINGSYSC